MDTQQNTKFEHVRDLERKVKACHLSLEFAPLGLPDRLWQARHNAHEKAKATLYAAIDALSTAEMAAYGEYRCTA